MLNLPTNSTSMFFISSKSFQNLPKPSCFYFRECLPNIDEFLHNVHDDVSIFLWEFIPNIQSIAILNSLNPQTTPSWSPTPLPSYWLSDGSDCISTCDVYQRILLIYRDILVYGSNLHDLLIVCFPLGGGSHDLRLAAADRPESQLTLSTLPNSHIPCPNILPFIQHSTLPHQYIIKPLQLKPIYFSHQPFSPYLQPKPAVPARHESPPQSHASVTTKHRQRWKTPLSAHQHRPLIPLLLLLSL